MSAKSWALIVGELRAAHGLTQPQLAERLGVSERTVRYWEAGVKTPTPRRQAWVRKQFKGLDTTNET